MISSGDITIPVRLMRGPFNVSMCSKGVWQKITQCRTDNDYIEAGKLLLNDDLLALYDCRLLVSVYIQSMEKMREEMGFIIPDYPVTPTGKEVKYTVYTQFDKLAADYANMSLYEIDNIPIMDYWLILRDAFISRLSVTEKGREYLNNAYRLTQTEADDDISIGR